MMMGAEVLSDAELVKRCRGKDEKAWNEFVERFSRYVYAICMQAFRMSEHEAEDVFQEVFTRAFERLDTLRDDTAVKPWIAQMTRRLAIDRIRSTKRVLVTDEVPEQEFNDELARLDEALLVREVLKTLPENCLEVVDRFFVRDESYRTISEALGIPSGTIASRISRCLAKLKAELEGST